MGRVNMDLINWNDIMCSSYINIYELHDGQYMIRLNRTDLTIDDIYFLFERLSKSLFKFGNFLVKNLNLVFIFSDEPLYKKITKKDFRRFSKSESLVKFYKFLYNLKLEFESFEKDYNDNYGHCLKMDIILRRIRGNPLESDKRRSGNYHNWRETILKRDNYSCQCCGRSKSLEVHHLHPYSERPDLRLDVNNGVILCKECHKRYHYLYDIDQVNPMTFSKFLRRYSHKHVNYKYLEKANNLS